MKKNIKRGFTLIELLVVISIIGILAALAVVSYSVAQKQARDTERKSDLKQYQTSLETYANRQSSQTYPVETSTNFDPSNLCSTLGITGTCPKDPDPALYAYGYVTDSAGTEYMLWAYLESQSKYFVVCSNGENGFVADKPDSSSLPCPNLTQS